MAKKTKTSETRRSFLSKVGIGTAALALGASPLLNWIRKESSYSANMNEDSIFNPRKPKA